MQYELKTYKREKMLAPAELKEVHPLGKSPIISIETEEMPKPLILAESGPIVEYLTDHFNPGLTPTRYQAGKEGQIGGETEEWLRYRYLMHYVEGSLMILMVVAIIARSQEHQDCVAKEIADPYLQISVARRFHFSLDRLPE